MIPALLGCLPRIGSVRRRNLTHHNLGVLLGLGLERLLAGRQATGGGAESSAGDDGSHWDGVVSRTGGGIAVGRSCVGAWIRCVSPLAHTIDFVKTELPWLGIQYYVRQAARGLPLT